jgi:hypothetical protein
MSPKQPYGDHELYFQSANSETNIGLRVFCKKCGASAFGTMHIWEIRVKRDVSLMAERAEDNFKLNFPKNCNESMIKVIQDS